MDTATSERRFLALAGNGRRFDLVAPADATVGQALSGITMVLDPERHLLMTHDGREVSRETRLRDLEDGVLLSIIDIATGEQSRPRFGRGTTARESFTPWWLLGTAGAILSTMSLVALSGGATLLDGGAQLSTVAVFGVGAVAATAVWTRRVAGTALSDALTLVASMMLAFAAGVSAVPAVARAPHLGVTVGLLGAAAVLAVVPVTARGPQLRGVAGTVAAILLVLSGLWGLTLWLGWTTTAAAAMSVGIVAPALRFLPSTLLNIPEGYAIDYQHFMSSRWTVRGAIPEDPGPVTMARLGPVVTESSSRLAAGTVLLSVIATVMVPFMVGGLSSPHTLVAVGTAGTLAMTVLALMLMPRHSSAGVLRWMPRIAAGVVLLQMVLALSLGAGPVFVVVLAGVLMALGLLAVVVSVPISRGMSSLAWSRLGDMVERIAVALALPLAMLSANTVESVREMMSG